MSGPTQQVQPAPEGGEEARRGLRLRTPAAFSSLRHRNYRLLWMGNVVSRSGDWMDQIAFNWLVYDMTGSAVALAALNLCRSGPMLFFTMIGGVVADRVERRKLLYVTQIISMTLALLLAGLLSAGLLAVWMAFVIAVGRGVTNSFNQPARQSLISDLVPREDLPSAVALNSATINLTKVIGPAIGGLMIAFVSIEGAFYLNGLSFLGVVVSLFLMDMPPHAVRAVRTGIFSDLIEGMRYLRHEVSLRTLVILALVPMLLGQPYQTLLTIFAKDVFHAGGEGLGLMQSVAGLGSVAGAIFIASSSANSRFVLRMMMGLVAFGGSLAVFAFSPTLWVALIALACVGFANQTYMTSNNTMLQMNVDPEYRGRVLSTMFLERGLVPLGTMAAGLASALVGPRWTIGTMAAGIVLMGLLVSPYVLRVLSHLDGPGGHQRRRALHLGGEAVSASEGRVPSGSPSV